MNVNQSHKRDPSKIRADAEAASDAVLRFAVPFALVDQATFYERMLVEMADALAETRRMIDDDARPERAERSE